MRAVFSIVALSVALPAHLAAQQLCGAEQPKTRLEAFLAQDSVVIIRGFSRIGEVAGHRGTSVVIESRELTDAGTQRRAYGIAVEVREGGDSVRTRTALVDFEEIPSLLSALDYIGKLEKTATALDQFQVRYRTKGDLVVATFSTDAGPRATIASGVVDQVEAHMGLTDLDHVRELIQEAYASLTKLRANPE